MLARLAPCLPYRIAQRLNPATVDAVERDTLTGGVVLSASILRLFFQSTTSKNLSMSSSLTSEKSGSKLERQVDSV
jgi:hypothetical protein